MPHPELAAEQAYVDNAYAQLEKMRETLAGVQDRMATEFAAVAMEAWLKRRHTTFQDAERGLCFGRLTLDATLRPLYVGRRWVHDDAHEALVVNWQAPAARPFYTATPQDPHGVTQRRRFRTEGRRLVDISDESLDGSAVEGATVSDFLLEELDRRREGRMRDIVATIQSDQYRLITAEPEGALVVQGGPGTGKTAVGLHRASWLSSHIASSSAACSSSGRTRSSWSTSRMCCPPSVRGGRTARRHRDARRDRRRTRGRGRRRRAQGRPAAERAVQRAVELSVRPAPEGLVLYADGVFVSIKERDVRELLDSALDAGLALGPARERFRMTLLRRFYERYGELLGPRALGTFDDLERALRRNGFLAKYLDRVLPLPRARKGRRAVAHLTFAARRGGRRPLDRDEQRLLLRDRPRRASELRWSDHDLPLLDVARTLIEGPTNVRARDRGRGAEPLADAATHGLAKTSRSDRRRSTATSRDHRPDEIVRFAKEFDPQPFHTDPDIKGPFGEPDRERLAHGVAVHGHVRPQRPARQREHGLARRRGAALARARAARRRGTTGRSRVVDAWPSERDPGQWHDHRRARARESTEERS